MPMRLPIPLEQLLQMAVPSEHQLLPGSSICKTADDVTVTFCQSELIAAASRA